jgi:hypothetical protein
LSKIACQGTHEAKVHIEAHTDVIHFSGNAAGSPFMDVYLFLPLNMLERMKLEQVGEAVNACGKGSELIFATVSKLCCP